MNKAFPLFFILGLVCLSLSATPKFTMDQLQGAWWSDVGNPTADFAIDKTQVWLDYDSAFHPCRIEEDILIFELGPELGQIKNRILSLDGNHLELEHLDTKSKWSLNRASN